MKLSFEQIKSLTVGAVSMRADAEGRISFFKCTEKQSAAWYALSQTLGDRSLTTTGIRLDFHTDSKKMRFSFSSGNKVEVLINGLLRAQFLPKDGKIAGELDINLPYGRPLDNARVTLVFPSHTVGVLDYLELDDSATFTRHIFDRKLLFIGDSITQGHASKFDSFSYAWQTTLFFNAESVINGIGGAFYHITTFDKPDFDPDTVILAYGTNDFLRYRNNYDELYRQVTTYQDLIKEAYPNKQIIVISPVFCADAGFTPKGEWFDSYRRMIENEAAKRGFDVIFGLELLPPIPNVFSDEYLHPNDLGFAHYALNLTSKLRHILK